MTFGIGLRGMNAVFFNSRLDFFTEFLPMAIFAISLFGMFLFRIRSEDPTL
jgi:hypothetical protein